MREVIQCLIDWLDSEPSDEKGHRILRALAQESLKKAEFEESKRRFTADAIVAAIGETLESAEPKKWIDWPGSLKKYCETREPQIIEFARKRGLPRYPKPDRKSTKGGPGRHTTFYIKAEPVPDIMEEEQSIEDMRTGGKTADLQVNYQMTALGEVKPSWIASWLFRRGQIELRQWHVWVLLGWLATIAGFALLIAYAGWLSLSVPRPVTTQDLTLLISIFVIPYGSWVTIIKPWILLLDDRIVVAHELFTNFYEQSAQFELLRDGDLRVVRLVRYSAPCPICGATIYLEKGEPDYRRRLVGRCYESPREHVFSFDRITRCGRLLVDR
ncbi:MULTISPECIES: hypothetical protein [Methylomonas]|uniref:Uncharacterized protein n=2 Tax=Methylomonas TaxID=416 RepID=A0A140E7K4_9GAMM|nr:MULTISPECIES: hypothetical protein [Methylomonas]AMK79378.1 hypothetical protein JT25_023305 [Methylomonas denitrificans]OAI03201.1 hypothetical protein A1342_08755 [Methylomonas methanica]TCV86100.1 hypothetical protein EDE11_10444 [Methylomonas methanica]